MSYLDTQDAKFSKAVLAFDKYENSCRANDVSQSLRASVHDALWMITQQHRTGEFLGTDNGSVLKARLKTKSQLINRYQPGSETPRAYEYTEPLNALVEKVAAQVDTAQRIRMGRYFTKMLGLRADGNELNGILSDYKAVYDISGYASTDYENRSNARANNIRQFVSGELLDGYELYVDIKASNPTITKTPYTATTVAELDAIEQDFLTWFEASAFFQNSTDTSWTTARLENQYSCAAPQDSTSNADQHVLNSEHQEGDIEWYDFTIDGDNNAELTVSTPSDLNDSVAGRDTVVTEILNGYPSPVYFRGMPSSRWWQFEDQKVDLAAMLVEMKDTFKLMLQEFAVTFSHDWLLLPVNLRVGSVTEVDALVITDTFGVNVVIDSAGTGPSNSWQTWSMFSLNQDSTNVPQTEAKLFVPPVNDHYELSDEIERTIFVKDEMANLVWGVEETISNDLGEGQAASAAYDNFMNLLKAENVYDASSDPFTPVDTGALLHYKLVRNMPENWIPFMAVNTINPGSNHQKEIRFRKAKVRRTVDDYLTNDYVSPRTTFLQQSAPYDIHEEELLEGNIKLSGRFKRARWWDGSTHVWYNYSKSKSAANYKSGLEFDTAIDEVEERIME